MAGIPFEHGLMLAGVLFVLGVIGILVRRNIVFVLMSIEIMLNAAGLALVTAAYRWGQPDGQVMFLFILATAGAEVAVGLAFVIQMNRKMHSMDVDAASEMKG